MKKTKLSAMRVGMTMIAVMLCATAKAQDQVEVSVGADVVSNYIWRGQDCGGVSIQPSISIAKSGFSLTAWGSAGFDKVDTKEFDLTAGYTYDNLSIGITDYWFDSSGYFDYDSHVFEGTVGYDFGPLALSWSTNFAGNHQDYSSYAEVAVPFTLAGINFGAELGLTPWKGAYSSSGLSVVNIGLGAAKDIQITESFTLPAFAKIVVNPHSEKAYFVFGVSF